LARGRNSAFMDSCQLIRKETKAVLKQCAASRAKLGELKQAAKLIPNQKMLINIIPLLEAKDSSEIENYSHHSR